MLTQTCQFFRYFALTGALVVPLSGCAVASAAAGAAISVTGAAASAAITVGGAAAGAAIDVGGKVVGKAVDAMTAE